MKLHQFRTLADAAPHVAALFNGLPLIRRLEVAIPRMRKWVLNYKESIASNARPVASLSVPNLSRCYPTPLLESTRVLITNEIGYPPLEQFGLEELKYLDTTPWAGVTFDDVYLLRGDLACPALHFHELVHVVQCRRLGVERFLWAYYLGLALHGYEESPFEKMAYDLQIEFEHGIYRRSLLADIE
jgi:hypothetical protein